MGEEGADVIRRLTVVNIVLVLFVVAVVVGGTYLVKSADPNAGHTYCLQLNTAPAVADAGRGVRQRSTVEVRNGHLARPIKVSKDV